jgi:carbon storage regulator
MLVFATVLGLFAFAILDEIVLWKNSLACNAAVIIVFVIFIAFFSKNILPTLHNYYKELSNARESIDMLHITRKEGESVIINNTIEIQVLEVVGRKVKLGCSFPHGSSILRKELHLKITSENQKSISEDIDSLDFNIKIPEQIILTDKAAYKTQENNIKNDNDS